MRQAMFAVVLVAASFAGGAVVNGPGLRWAQAFVMQRLGMDEAEGEGPAGAKAAAAIAPLAAEPRAATPVPRAAEPPPVEKALKGDAPAGMADPKGPRPAAAERPAKDREAASPLLSGPAVPVESIPPLEPQSPPSEPPATRDGAVVRVSEDEPAPAATPAPAEEGASLPGPPADWAGVRRAMKALGVTRYGVEGEIGGRTRFHCVIPVAGRRAVGQHFEAEGDDDLKAAQAALRRVTLWRATEAKKPSP